MPSAMLVGVGSLLIQIYSQAELDPGAALTSLTKQPLGILIVILFALVLATIVIQAFEFEVIRVLEGYWGTSRLPVKITISRIKRHLKRRQDCEKRISRYTRSAFSHARQQMIADDVDRELVDILETDILGRDPRSSHPAERINEARAMGWRHFARPPDLRVLDANMTRLAGYPEQHRLLPTRLGNTLRAAEDSLRLADGGDLQGLVLRNYKFIPPQLMSQQAQFRTRLDMYCSLVPTFGLLALLATLALWKFGPSHAPALATAAALLLLSALSYGAAISSASGYGAVLHAIDQTVFDRRQNPPAPSITTIEAP